METSEMIKGCRDLQYSIVLDLDDKNSHYLLWILFILYASCTSLSTLPSKIFNHERIKWFHYGKMSPSLSSFCTTSIKVVHYKYKNLNKTHSSKIDRHFLCFILSLIDMNFYARELGMWGGGGQQYSETPTSIGAYSQVLRLEDFTIISCYYYIQSKYTLLCHIPHWIIPLFIYFPRQDAHY